MPQIWFNPCFAHVINLVSNAWASYNGFATVNGVLKHIKSTFVYSSNTRKAWFYYQQRFGIFKPRKVLFYT